MSNFTVVVPAAVDRDIYAFFRTATELLGAQSFYLQVRGSHNGNEFKRDNETELDLRLKDSILYSISNGSVSLNHFSISFNRDGNSSPQFDKLAISNGQSSSVSDDVLFKLNELIDAKFVSPAGQSSALFTNPKAFEALISSHQQLLARLEGTATHITEEMVTARLRLEEEFASRASSLEADYAQRRTDLTTEIDGLREEINSRELSLTERQKLLDDRDHIHARRQLREQITQNIARRLEESIVPPSTSTVGTLVLILILMVSSILGYVSFSSFLQFSQTILTERSAASPASAGPSLQSELWSTWPLLARGFLASVGAIAFVIYGISWLKSLYNDRLRAHRDLERYSIDLNRASWAVETMMEAKAADKAIPDILIAGIAKNLFETSTLSNGKENGEDTLASLLRASAKAKIGPAGAEFEMNGRGASKLADKIERT